MHNRVPKDRWLQALPPSYVNLMDVTHCVRCPTCREYPKVWIFEDGAYADCKCATLGEGGAVRVESMMSYANRHDGNISGYPNTESDLTRMWNIFIDTNIPQNKLPAGYW